MSDLTNIIGISFIIVLILVIIFYPSCECEEKKLTSEGSEGVEGMANLSYGTFENNYPAGRCANKSLERTDCMVGNCNLDSPVTHDQLCYIDCAQISDEADRNRCMKECRELMKYC
jgi:hypothetical protein